MMMISTAETKNPEYSNMNIGGYEVIRTLGKGGMSEVYEVEKISVGPRHALKLFTYPREDADVRARFETEGKLLAKLNHPRIVKVTDIGTDSASGKPYFRDGSRDRRRRRSEDAR